MANRERGEVPLVVTNGDGTTHIYILRLSINALCEVEDLLSQSSGTPVSFTEIMARAGTGRMREIRAIVWAALQERHRDQFPTLESAGELIQLVGITNLGDQLQALQGSTTPDPADVAELPKPNPPEAQG
jgi:hypothetical protein